MASLILMKRENSQSKVKNGCLPECTTQIAQKFISFNS